NSRPGVRHQGHRLRWRKTPLISLNGTAAAKASNVPVSAMLRAARMNAPQATRARADPTDTRRTPRSASRASESTPLGVDINTLTGLGETAFTMAAIASESRTPGA